MKKVLLAALISSLVLTSAYAINPSTSTTKPNYGGASFVNDEDAPTPPPPIPRPVAKQTATTTTTSNTQGSNDPITTLSPSQNTVLSQAGTSTIQVTAATAVKTPNGCPVTCPQKTGIIVKKEVIQKIVNRQINSSNANDIEELLGPPCSCITFNPLSADVWTCQWKGDLSSNRLENTINVTFEGGMLAGVTAVRDDGVTYMAMPNANVTVYQPQ